MKAQVVQKKKVEVQHKAWEYRDVEVPRGAPCLAPNLCSAAGDAPVKIRGKAPCYQQWSIAPDEK